MPHKLRVGSWELHHNTLRPSHCLLQAHNSLLLSAPQNLITFHLTGNPPTTLPPNTIPTSSVSIPRSLLIEAGGPLRTLVAGGFKEQEQSSIVIHEKLDTFQHVHRFLTRQPLSLDKVNVDLALVADRWCLSTLFEALFLHAEERARPYKDCAAIPTGMLIVRYLPIMAVVDVPMRFKRFLAMKMALDLEEVDKFFETNDERADMDDVCTVEHEDGVACRRRKKGADATNRSRDSKVGGEKKKPVVECNGKDDNDDSEMVFNTSKLPILQDNVTEELFGQDAPSADKVDAKAGEVPLCEDSVQCTEADSALSSTIGEEMWNGSGADDMNGEGIVKVVANGALEVGENEFKEHKGGDVGEDVVQGDLGPSSNATAVDGAVEVAAVVEEVVGSAVEAAQDGNGDDVVVEENEEVIEEESEQVPVIGDGEPQAQLEQEHNDEDDDDELVHEETCVPPPPYPIEPKAWHKEFDVWRVLQQQKMMRLFIHYLSNYGGLDYRMFLLDIILGKLEPTMEDDEEVIDLLRQIDWYWEGPIYEMMTGEVTLKWSTRAWRLVALAQLSGGKTGIDVRMNWTYKKLFGHIRDRAAQLANRNDDSDANMSNSSDDEHEDAGFSAEWAGKAGDEGFEFGMSLQCQDPDPNEIAPLNLNIRMLNRTDDMDKKTGRREVTVRIKVIECGCGCGLGDEDEFQGFTASPTKNADERVTDLRSFGERGNTYKIMESDQFEPWIKRHTSECGLTFQVRLYIFPVAESGTKRRDVGKEEKKMNCLCGYCECEGCEEAE